MWTDSDYYNDYEPYGKLAVSIGTREENQNIKLWNVLRKNSLVVPLNKAKVVSGTHIFRESPCFMRNGILTLHGKVMEEDIDNDVSTDDVIGSYEGETFAADELESGKKFPGDSSYAKITMKVVRK